MSYRDRERREVLDCCEHSQTTDICERMYEGRQCPACGSRKLKEFKSNGGSGASASFHHIGCVEGVADIDFPEDISRRVFEWDAEDYWRCEEHTREDNEKWERIINPESEEES